MSRLNFLRPNPVSLSLALSLSLSLSLSLARTLSFSFTLSLSLTPFLIPHSALSRGCRYLEFVVSTRGHAPSLLLPFFVRLFYFVKIWPHCYRLDVVSGKRFDILLRFVSS